MAKSTYDRLLLEQGIEETQPIADPDRAVLRRWRVECCQIQPDVERRVWNVLITDPEPNILQPSKDIITLHLEMRLQRLHLRVHLLRLQHLDRRLLKRDVRPSVQVRSTGSQGRDELLRPHDPRDAPSGQAETLGHAVDKQDVVFVHVLDVGGRARSSAVTVAAVVVARVELVEDDGGAVAADVLDQGHFVVFEGVAGWVAGIRGEDDGGAAGELFGDFVGVDVVAVFAGERGGDGDEVLEQGEHLVVGGIVWDEEPDIRVAQYRRDPYQARSAPGDHTYILPCVLTILPLPVVHIIQIRDRRPQRLDPRRRAILPRIDTQGDRVRPLERPFDLIVDFRCALT